MSALLAEKLHAVFGERLRENVPLAPYTSARIGGPADLLLTARSASELAEIVRELWTLDVPFMLLGGGSNVLVSDRGVRGVTVLNRAKNIQIDASAQRIWAESGAAFSTVARRAAAAGLSGLEWAAAVPGTLGGAVYGNAGAFGGDMAACLHEAEILTREGMLKLSSAEMAYAYRSSCLKRGEKAGVILAASLQLKPGQPAEIEARMAEISARRRDSQPPGASMGSMFKNPAGDYAGRLIEAAGLKGLRVGNVEVSPVHANFFVNHGETRAADVRQLIETVRQTVYEKFAVRLELEIELVGEW